MTRESSSPDPNLPTEDALVRALRTNGPPLPPDDRLVEVLSESAPGDLSEDESQRTVQTVLVASFDRRLSRAAARSAPLERTGSFGEYLGGVLEAAGVSAGALADRLGVPSRWLDDLRRSDLAVFRLPPRVLAEILDALNLPVERVAWVLRTAVRDLSSPGEPPALRLAASMPAGVTPSIDGFLNATAQCLRTRDRADLAGSR